MRDGSLQRFRNAALGLVRRGPREVLWTWDSVRLGNYLYYWAHAHRERASGRDLVVLETPDMTQWQPSLPTVFESLTIPRRAVGITDRRVSPGSLQQHGVDFDRDSLARFIDEVILHPRNVVAGYVDELSGRYDVTINVRRGDYYSVPKWRGEYSFDVVEYVAVAIEQVLDQGPVDSIHLVSDDLDWCRTKLGWLADIAPVTMPADQTPVLEQLAMLAASPRLILTNSTFSYWGGYLSDHRHRARKGSAGVWAPAFCNRLLPQSRATQLLPDWRVIEDIPGGWDG